MIRYGMLKSSGNGPLIGSYRVQNLPDAITLQLTNGPIPVLYNVRPHQTTASFDAIVTGAEVLHLATGAINVLFTVVNRSGIAGSRRESIRLETPVVAGKSWTMNGAPLRLPAGDTGLEVMFTNLAVGRAGVDANPYNFVALTDKPWLENDGAGNSIKAQNHAAWNPDLLHGWLTFKLIPLTPLFVPDGFPIRIEDETLKNNLPRHFCRLHRWGGGSPAMVREHYAIPGGSLKGPLRAMVEAITQDRFGASDAHEGQLLYKRGPNDLGTPALRTVGSLMGDFYIDSERYKRDLHSPLGLAEQMFGYVAPHKEGSEPLRGKLRFSTAWGPTTIDTRAQEDNWQSPEDWEKESEKPQGMKVWLAPLTSPTTTTQGKSSPLYLEPLDQENSASYFDDEPPNLRGRKFYWKQRPPEGRTLWGEHTRSASGNQQPPPLCVLAPIQSNAFDCRIDFENMTPVELGALVFALQGDGNGERTHAMHLGKGKPRGLGVCGVQDLKILTEKPQSRYESLVNPPAAPFVYEASLATDAFKAWCRAKSKPEGDAVAPNFESIDHIRDFIHLHTWPGAESFRYYPLKFDDFKTSFPRERRPRAMKRARDLNP